MRMNPQSGRTADRNERMTTLTYRSTFSRVGAFIYAGGIASFIASLVVGFPVREMPEAVHLVILIAAGYSGIGFLVYARRAVLHGTAHRVIYVLILLHLNGSAVLHLYSIALETNQWISVFPAWYPYLAIVYFGVFGAFCLGLEVR